jgi:hypothetical protein
MAFPRRYKLRDLLIAAFCVALLAVMAIQYLAVRRWESRKVACASNLRALWGCAFNYEARHRRHDEYLRLSRMNSDTGAAFFMRLQAEYPPLSGRLAIFFCPISGEPIGPQRTSYRGPAVDVNSVTRIDIEAQRGIQRTPVPVPMAADKEGNHGPGRGGNVLTQVGDVMHVEESDSLWIRARITTKE